MDNYLILDFCKPSLLNDWIEYFIVFKGNGFFSSEVYAQPFAYLLLNSNQKLDIAYRDKKINTNNSLIEPINTKPFKLSIEFDKNSEIFGLKVKSSFLYLITGIPLNNLTGNIFNIDEIFSENISTILEKINTAKTIQNKTQIAEYYFIKKIKAIQERNKSDDYNALKYLSHSFYTSFTIDQLTDRLNVSHRTLDRHFQKYVGVSPKKMLSLVRFYKTLEYSMKYHSFDLETLWNFGYYDYAHFSKDFKKYCGQTFESFKMKLKVGENLQVNEKQSPVLLPEMTIY